MRLQELIYRCGNIGKQTYFEIRRSDEYMFAGFIEDMPDIYKCYAVRYFEYVGDNRFEIVLM